MAIEVFADVGCPFTHVGIRRFVEERARLGRSDVLLRVHAWPLEVVNSEPMDPSLVAEEIEQITAQVGDDYFTGFRAGTFPTTSIDAMALASAGYLVDDPTGEAISLELRDLLFEKGTDISDPGLLAEMAQRHGVDFDTNDRDAHTKVVMADHELGKTRGVIGSPHFFTDEHDYFCPALEVGHDESGDLRVTFDPDGFSSFLRDCFDNVE